MYEHKCCCMYTVHTQYILCIYCKHKVHTQYILEHFVHFTYMHCTYQSIGVHTLYIHCTWLGLRVCGDCLKECSFHRWTADEPSLPRKVIVMLRNPEFDAKDVDPDLHKRTNKAVEDGRIKSFNMREGPVDSHPFFNLKTRLQQSLTSTVSARIQASRWGAPIQQRWMAGAVAMSMSLV